ncbi:hypothetical protein ACIQOV_20375 [Kitasatospora sp. NPDC091257]|uniref:hypothetical protein n=1 Tax=Kitasatospora sp. NPDC091257 TaxID=3364084 RepID=UPI00381B7BFB
MGDPTEFSQLVVGTERAEVADLREGAPAGSRSGAELDAMARFATFGYEPFFLAGGLLFAAASLGHRAPGRSAVVSRSAARSAAR